MYSLQWMGTSQKWRLGFGSRSAMPRALADRYPKVLCIGRSATIVCETLRGNTPAGLDTSLSWRLFPYMGI